MDGSHVGICDTDHMGHTFACRYASTVSQRKGLVYTRVKTLCEHCSRVKTLNVSSPRINGWILSQNNNRYGLPLFRQSFIRQPDWLTAIALEEVQHCLLCTMK